LKRLKIWQRARVCTRRVSCGPKSMLRSLSPQTTHDILYSKLKEANGAIRVSETRAISAERDAQRFMEDAASSVVAMTSALRVSEEGRRVAEARIDTLSRPDPDRLKAVQAMELDAHAARKTAKECCEEPSKVALEEEARFQTARARQARHCLMTGTTPRVVAAHLHTGPTRPMAMGSNNGDGGDLVRLELAVAMERAFDRSSTASGIAARHSTHTQATQSDRTDRYVQAVSLDLQEGLQREVEAYDAAAASSEATMR